ncbi:MAG: nickel-dependent hydrogenase large subunit [Desulfobacterales bacterium]|jgi:[NiFe] hydrogenase large subunit
MPKPTDLPRGKKKDKDPPAPPPGPDPDPAPDPAPEPPPGGVDRITIDPVTRIEGHLRIEVEVTDGFVSDAWSSGTLFRGIENILNGRDPADAWLFTQRLCGVCTYVHGSTSVRCVEDALGLTVPKNARILRNLMMGAQFLHDHIVHFYHLHALDWVDIVSALGADIVKTASLAKDISPFAPTIDFGAVKNRLRSFVGTRQLGPFAEGYWGHPAYLLSPEENLLLTAHYLQALHQQAKTARLHAIFGGKNPHVQSLRVGGLTCRYDLNNGRLGEFGQLLQETRDFIDAFYIPDAILVAKKYSDWAGIGSSENFMAFGEFPRTDQEPQSLYLPRGVIFSQGDVRALNPSAIKEHVEHSWYSGSTALHPSNGQTVPNYTGLNTEASYSWLKAPRYQDQPMEVGPLARILMAYNNGNGLQEAVDLVQYFLDETGFGADALYSTLGRTAARALETVLIADAMTVWLDDLDLSGSVSQSWTMPAQAAGMGMNEAPRGALGHWINIENQKIGNYQMVIPSTWNFGPRCANKNRGPVEQALIGTPVSDTSRPLEVLRVVHSFDPCIACAVHVIDTQKDRTFRVKVN